MLNGISWRTGLQGLMTTIVGVGLVGAGALMPMAPTIAALIVTSGIAHISSGIGLLFAKDSNVTTENGVNKTVKK